MEYGSSGFTTEADAVEDMRKYFSSTEGIVFQDYGKSTWGWYVDTDMKGRV